MNITIKAMKYQLTPETEALIEEKLAAPLRLLGDKAETALLEIELEEAPPEGRSSEPVHLIARLAIEGKHEVFKAEATKPTPEIAADRVRSELEQEIRKSRGRTRRLFRRGASAIKNMMRFGV
jgi:ribosome-associated translation inhibitor RaiA